MKRFWAVTAYDAISRSLLDSGGNITVSSMSEPEVNADGSVDIYFGTESARREGKATGSRPTRTKVSSWYSVSTVRWKGYINKTWVLNDFELLK